MPIGPCLVGNVQNFWDVFVHRILILRMNWLMFSGEILISLDETSNLFVVYKLLLSLGEIAELVQNG